MAPRPQRNQEAEGSDRLPDSIRRAALRAVGDGAISKAARLLSEELHSVPTDCQAALQALHPCADAPALPAGSFPIGDDFSLEEVLQALSSFAPGSSGGFSGLMPDHIKGPESPAQTSVLGHLARICSDFAWGRFPPEHGAILAGARLIPIGKTGGGVRPIAVGEFIRRLAGKLLVQRYQMDAAKSLPPVQYGVGVKGGAEAIIHHARAWLETAPPDHGLLQLDFSNAYNSIHREHLLQAVATHCPIFLHYAKSCYANPVTLFAAGYTIASEEGQHQGCPCGPLFFSASILCLSRAADSIQNGWSKWYLDDGHLAGSIADLDTLLAQLEPAAANLGLKLNRKKCALLKASSHDNPDWLKDIPRIQPDQCMRILGSPVGPVEACKAWVKSNTIDPLALALGRLAELANPQAASLILRQCLSGCKVNWILRTTDPETALWTAHQVSPLLRQAWATLLGSDPGDAQWELACLPIRLGGAGLNDPIMSWDAACLASWAGSLSMPGVKPQSVSQALVSAMQHVVTRAPSLGSPLLRAAEMGIVAVRQHALFAKWKEQSFWSDEIQELKAKVWDSTVTERLRSLRRLQCAPDGGLWLTALPAASPDRISAPEFQALLQVRTGARLWADGTPCKGCGTLMDGWGDHAQSCASCGMYKRHNRQRNNLWSLGEKAGWDPELEKTIPGSTDRPDVVFKTLNSRPLAIDVTIVHPLRPSSQPAARGESPVSATVAEKAKNAHYVPLCNRANPSWGFRPFAMETTGGMGPGATLTTKQLIRYCSMRSGEAVSAVAARIRESLHVTLAKGRAEMLVAARPVEDS